MSSQILFSIVLQLLLTSDSETKVIASVDLIHEFNGLFSYIFVQLICKLLNELVTVIKNLLHVLESVGFLWGIRLLCQHVLIEIDSDVD